MIINDYSELGPSDFRNLFEKVSSAISERYQIRVSESERTGKNAIGMYNGNLIVVKESLSYEKKLFLLAHLFGHCIQWSHEPDKCESVGSFLSSPDPEAEDFEERIRELRAYEEEAAQYSVTLLGTVAEGLEQWLSDWFESDWKYVVGILLEEDREFCFEQGHALVGAKDIPEVDIVKMEPKYAY